MGKASHSALAHLASQLLSWLLGPLVSCLVAAILGIRLQGIRIASESMRTVLGLAVGASITAALLARLDTMLLFGEAAGGNLRSMSLIQVTRVLVVAATLPFIQNHSFGMDLSQLSTATHEIVPLSQLALMLFCAAYGWRRRGPSGCPPFDPHPCGHFRCTIILSHFQIENGRKVAFTPVCISPKHPS